MNKELYIKKEITLQELMKSRALVNCLQTFLSQNEKNFKQEESIEALKRIRFFLTLKEEEYQKIQRRKETLEQKLLKTCQHEVAIKYSNVPHYYCLICNCILEGAPPEDALLSIDTTDDYKVGNIIDKIFEEIVHSDKDLIETINAVLEEMQYERNIKIYRR